MNTEDRKAQFRAYYYRHLDANREKARVREAKKRAEKDETPEQAAERRRLNREWYARNHEERLVKKRSYNATKRGDEPMPDVASMTAPQRHQFLTLLIALLCQRRSEQLATRRDWQHQRYGTNARKPKVIKPKRRLMTLEEKRAKRAALARKWRARQPGRAERPPRVPKPPKPPQPPKLPTDLASARARRLEAARRWLAKMEATDPERYAAYKKKLSQYAVAYSKSTPQRRFAAVLRTKVYIAIRRQQVGKKSANTVTLTGCTIAEVMQHVEKQFKPGMTWANFGKGAGFWNIDHVRPLASFNLTDPAQQRLAFHWSNLSPAWSCDNIAKSSVWNGRRWSHSDHACVSPVEASASCSDKV